MKPVIYVIANKSLNMSAGKLAAQVGHAVAGLMTRETDNLQQRWQNSPQRWLIVLEAQDDMHLSAIREYLRERHLNAHMVIDEGVNEIRPFSFTALGIQVLDKDSPEASYLKDLPLYTDSTQEQLRLEFQEAMAAVRRQQYVAPRVKAVRWWNRWRSVA